MEMESYKEHFQYYSGRHQITVKRIWLCAFGTSPKFPFGELQIRSAIIRNPTLTYLQRDQEEDRMTQISEHHPRKTKGNVVLVGVAGVGKTTLGKLVAEKLEMLFVDVDMGFEDVEGSDIDTLLDRYGEEEFDNRLLTYLSEIISRGNHTIFAAPARVTHYKRFWEVVKENGASIHLRGKPMDVYMRQDMWVKGRKITKKEKLKKQWKREFYDYYEWRLRHCQKADYTVRIVGNKQTDTKNLCKKIAEIISTDNSEKDGVPNS